MATKVRVLAEKTVKAAPPILGPPPMPPLDEQEVRIRAYQKYCDRNGAPGDALTDWLQAESELRGLAQQHAGWTPTKRERVLLSARDSDTSGDPVC